jgi:general secretion pathway protein H
LLELLLVLVIVGLIVTIAGISVSSGSRHYTVDGAVRVFADIAEYAMDEAQLTGFDMGLLIEEHEGEEGPVYSFQWLQRGDGIWRDGVLDRELFGRQKFPDDIEVRLEVEEGETSLEQDSQEQEFQEQDIQEDDEPTLRPQVVFYNSGETTPGVLSLRRRDDGELLWEVEWDLIGRIELRRGGVYEDEE